MIKNLVARIKVRCKAIIDVRPTASTGYVALDGVSIRHAASLIEKSGIFDSDFYCSQAGIDSVSDVSGLITRYLKDGGTPISPHPLFSADYYLTRNPDVRKAGVNPLLHYITRGVFEGRNPSAFFDGGWYLEQYQDVKESKINPLSHYIHNGRFEGRDPHPLFMSDWYLARYPDVAEAGEDALSHYIWHGVLEHRLPNPFLDPAWYLEEYPDVASMDMSPFEHFYLYGAAEGRDPGPRFSTFDYCGNNPDIEGSGINPLVHYLRAGQFEGRGICSLSDSFGYDIWMKAFGQLTESELSAISDEPSTVFNVLVVSPPGSPSPIASYLHTPLNIKFTHCDYKNFCATDLSEFDYVAATDGALEVMAEAICFAANMMSSTKRSSAYFDEAIVGADEKIAEFDFKPDWSPLLYRNGGYSNSLVLYSVTAILNEEYSLTSPEESGLLPIDENVLHVPVVGATRRKSAASEGPATFPKGSLPGNPLVSIVIPTKDKLELIRECITGLLHKTDYTNIEIIVVDNGSTDADACEYLREVDNDPKVNVIAYPKKFNFSAICNFGASRASGSILCFLNNDIEIADPEWVDKILIHFQDSDAGAVGPMLLYPDGRIQHGGVVLGMGGVAGLRFSRKKMEEVPRRYLDYPHEVSAVSGACLFIKSDLFGEVGGFDETLKVSFNDIDLCLKVLDAGRRIIFVPTTRLIHHESVSLGRHDKGREEAFLSEVQCMKERWSKIIARDPYYNVNCELTWCNVYKPVFSNRRGVWLAEMGSSISGPADVDLLHGPLRWYATESNYDRATVARDSSLDVDVDRGAVGLDEGLAILIVTRDRPEYIIPLIRGLDAAHRLFAERGLRFHVYIGDTGSIDKKVLSFYRNELPTDYCTLIEGMTYHFSRCNNDLFESASNFSTVLFLNNDIEFETPGETLFKMYETLWSESDLGLLGSVLEFPDGTIQHRGVDVFRGGLLKGFVYHPDAGDEPKDAPGALVEWPAATGALLMGKSKVLSNVGCFDPHYAAECQDAALCLSAHQAGYKTKVINAGRVIHFENGTREKGEEHWGDRQRFHRQYYNWIDLHFLS